MKQAALILILFLSTASIGEATTVQLRGDNGLEWNQLRGSFEAVVHKWGDSTSSAGDSVQAWLVAQGYLDAVVSLTSDTLWVKTGCRFSIGTIKSIKEAQDVDSKFVGTPFTRDNLARVAETLLDDFRARGYYYSQVRMDAFHKYDSTVDIDVTVAPGPVVAIHETRYTGLSRTSPRLVDRHLSLRKGDTLTGALIARVEQRAAAIPYLQFVPPAVIVPRAGYTQADLELHFTEPKAVSLFGGIGVLPDDRSGAAWNLDMTLRNLFGDGRQIHALSDRRDPSHRLLEVQYQQPVFLAGVGNGSIRVATRDYRDQFYEFSLDSRYSTQMSSAASLQFGFGWKRVDPASDGRGYQRFSVEGAATLSSVDNPIIPSRGHEITWVVNYAHRRYRADSTHSGSSVNDTRTSLNAAFYLPLVRPFVQRFRLYYSGVESGERLLPMAELQYIGGPTSLRGYRSEQFVAQRIALGSLETHLNFSYGYLLVFYDQAYLNRPILSRDGSVKIDESYRQGYGVGIALADGSRAARLSLAWSPDLSWDRPYLSIELSTGL